MRLSRTSAVLAFLSVACLAALPVLAATKAGKAPKSTPELLAKGKAAFTTNCALCHGESGDGNTDAGKALKPPPRNFAKDKFKQGTKVEQIFVTISDGVKNTAMAGFGHLSEEDRWALAYHVLELRGKK